VAPPFGPLRFLYVGTKDTGRDLKFYVETLGAQELWRFKEFGADVAAVRLGQGPLVLLADHRDAPSVLPIYEVEDLSAVAKDLKKRGWKPKGAKVEIPNGPCYVFEDPSGNEYALFEDVRPNVFGDEAPTR
jgi:predicted enzyme related to lactoylglutathione lyase